MPDISNAEVRGFRRYSTYIRAHRNKTFVIHLPGPSLDAATLTPIAQDLVLLHSLGVRLVLVHGLPGTPEPSTTGAAGHAGPKVCTAQQLHELEQAIGVQRTRLESELGRGLVNAPGRGSRISIVSGNFVRARPFGIHDGVDLLHFGEVRNIDGGALLAQLGLGVIVLLSPLGYSPSGETYELDSESLAYHVAVALKAEKLILLIEDEGVRDADGKLIRDMTPESDLPALTGTGLLAVAAAREGVDRSHLISFREDGALLSELFTRDGTGTQITGGTYESIRTARPEDVAGLYALIEPMMRDGFLVQRTRENLEADLPDFTVIDRDGMVIACAALHAFGSLGELACLATHPDYRAGGRGDRCLVEIERRALEQGIATLFVQTTRGVDWFVERGFSESTIDQLPAARQASYNRGRNSKVFTKAL